MESSKALPCGLRPTSLMAFPRFVHVSKWSFSESTWDGRTAGLISTYHPASSFPPDRFLTSSACVFLPISTDPQKNPYQRATNFKTYLQAIWDTINLSDFFSEIYLACKFFVDYARGKPGTHSGATKLQKT